MRWKAQFRSAYLHQLRFGSVVCAVAALCFWWALSPFLGTEAALVLAGVALASLPLIALPPVLAVVGPFPTAERHRQNAELRAAYARHLEVEASAPDR